MRNIDLLLSSILLLLAATTYRILWAPIKYLLSQILDSRLYFSRSGWHILVWHLWLENGRFVAHRLWFHVRMHEFSYIIHLSIDHGSEERTTSIVRGLHDVSLVVAWWGYLELCICFLLSLWLFKRRCLLSEKRIGRLVKIILIILGAKWGSGRLICY